jgi:hypothetical protein
VDTLWVSLADACLRTGLNRERLLRLVQGRVIEGRQNVTGRWEVNRASLERYRKDAGAGTRTPLTADRG